MKKKVVEEIKKIENQNKGRREIQYNDNNSDIDGEESDPDN